jgi:hypothetical protein
VIESLENITLFLDALERTDDENELVYLDQVREKLVNALEALDFILPSAHPKKKRKTKKTMVRSIVSPFHSSFTDSLSRTFVNALQLYNSATSRKPLRLLLAPSSCWWKDGKGLLRTSSFFTLKMPH